MAEIVTVDEYVRYVAFFPWMTIDYPPHISVIDDDFMDTVSSELAFFREVRASDLYIIYTR